MTTVTRDDYSRKFYSVTVRRRNKQTSVEKSKCEDKPKSVLIVPGEYISKK